MSLLLPKVVLHEHIEGSVTPKIALLLAKKHQVTLDDDFLYLAGSYDENDFPYGRYQYDESDFKAFVDTYDKVAALVRDADDYYLILKDYLTRNAQKGMLYCEMITSAYHLCCNGNDQFDATRYHQILDALERAITEVQQEYGTITRLQACGVRHLSAQDLARSADFIAQQPRDIICGFNIAGNEKVGQFSDFSYVHQLVDDIPLPKSYHAGEIEGPQSIYDALQSGAKRIGHGIAAIKDEALIEKLIEKKITLEISPTSNRILVTEFKQTLADHPLRKLYDKGVRLSINTDDAGVFGTDIEKEYQIAVNEFGFSRIELLDVTLCALEAAFVDEPTRQKLINKVYLQFSEQDWQDLKHYCQQLEQAGGALYLRLKERLSMR